MGSKSRGLRARTNVHAVNFLRRFGGEFMNKHLGWAVASVVSLGIGGVSAASAADMARKAPAYRAPPPVAVWDCSGFYIGGNVGGAWSDNHTTYTMPFTTPWQQLR
jgi:hypothetical protein